VEEKGGRVAELLGRHRYQLDPKGRIALPARFREEFVDGAWLTLGQERAVYVFPQLEWERLRSEVPVNPFSSPQDRALARIFFSSAERVRLDKQGRLLVPQSLREEVGIDREAVVVGVSNRLEIWAAAEWDRYQDEQLGPYVAGTLVPTSRG